MGNEKSKLSQQDIEELKNISHFDEKEILDWHKGFVKDCPKGHLTTKQFQKMYSEAFDGDATDFAKQVFRSFDKDGNGVIDFKEFICCMSITSKGTMTEKLDFIFNVYDADGNGFISREEMLKILTSFYRMQGDEVAKRRKADEQTPEQCMEKIFEKYDQDDDGYLSKEEFMKGAKHDPFLLLMMKKPIKRS